MKNEETIQKIRETVEIIAARSQDQWALDHGHDQKWETIDEATKQLWRGLVTVGKVMQELSRS